MTKNKLIFDNNEIMIIKFKNMQGVFNRIKKRTVSKTLNKRKERVI